MVARIGGDGGDRGEESGEDNWANCKATTAGFLLVAGVTIQLKSGSCLLHFNVKARNAGHFQPPKVAAALNK
ncbi:MAG: hypothetical protein AAFR90_12140 [Pseudomonadota bacterium]